METLVKEETIRDLKTGRELINSLKSGARLRRTGRSSQETRHVSVAGGDKIQNSFSKARLIARLEVVPEKKEMNLFRWLIW